MKLLEVFSRHFKIDAEIERFLVEDTQTQSFPKGTLLSQQATYNKTVFFMESGLARMFYNENGKDITANFYPEEKIFANIDTIFTQQAPRYNIETVEHSTITYCNYEKLEELCAISLPAANLSRYILGNLITQMSKRVASLQFKTAKEKYAQLLEENPNIILRAPLGMVASYLGISQETLSRIRAER